MIPQGRPLGVAFGVFWPLADYSCVTAVVWTDGTNPSASALTFALILLGLELSRSAWDNHLFVGQWWIDLEDRRAPEGSQSRRFILTTGPRKRHTLTEGLLGARGDAPSPSSPRSLES